MKVKVYKNLNNGRWSVRHKGKVIGHLEQVMLRDCVFHVGESSRQRVIRNRCREVHAWVTGELIELPVQVVRWRGITYNPYRSGSFTYRDNGQAISGASLVYFSIDGGAYAND